VSQTGRLDSCILVATEDDEVGAQLAALLRPRAFEQCPATVSQLLARLRQPDALRLLILADIQPDERVLGVLDAVKAARPELATLVLSRRPTIRLATDVIRRGGEDFVPIPFSDELLLKEVERILVAAELRDRVDSLHRLVSDAFGFERIVSRSSAMQPILERAKAASRSETPVLITGETGTGKELIARSIHASSRRAQRPLVPINCAGLPRDLVESELFGHRRGAFSGAHADHIGLFEAAHRGTLFLDEIGDLPLEAQAKLLRVLQDGEVRAVGGVESRKVDVRIIAATNRPLAALRGGVMRQDLFFRLSVLVIDVPPLRARQADLPLLVAHFLARLRERGAARVEGMDVAALDLLAGYSFPGNVRELENMLEGISLSLPPLRSTIRLEDVQGWLRDRGRRDPPPVAEVPSLSLRELEAWAVGEALRRTGGNKRRAAQLLGISRDTLYRKLQDNGSANDMPGSRT
jgi:two-component system response regulator HydG